MLGDLSPLDMVDYREPRDRIHRRNDVIDSNRKRIVETLINEPTPLLDVVELINIDISLVEKCYVINAFQLLKQNLTDDNSHHDLLRALNILIRYGVNLLKPEDERPKFWRAVKFSNTTFSEKVDVMKGARKILNEFGYTVRLKEGSAFPNGAEPHPLTVAQVVCDLMLCKQEVSFYSQGEHPYPHHIDVIVSEQARKFHSNKKFITPNEQTSASAAQDTSGRSNTKRNQNNSNRQFDWVANQPNSAPNKRLEHTQPSVDIKSKHLNDIKKAGYVSTPAVPLVDKVRNYFAKAAAEDKPRSVPPKIPPKTSSSKVNKNAARVLQIPEKSNIAAAPKIKDVEKASTASPFLDFEFCVLCGTDTATKHCAECGNSRCDICDEQWHSHFSRRNHIRENVFPDIVSDAIIVIPSAKSNYDDSPDHNSLAFQSTSYLHSQTENNKEKVQLNTNAVPMKVCEMDKHNFMLHLTRCFVLLCEKATEYGDYEQSLEQLIQEPSFEDNPEYSKLTRLKDDCKRNIYMLMDSFEKLKSDFQSRIEHDKEMAEDSSYVDIHHSREEKVSFREKKKGLDCLINDLVFSKKLLPSLCQLLTYPSTLVKGVLDKELQHHLDELDRKKNILSQKQEITEAEIIELTLMNKKISRFQAELNEICKKPKKRSIVARILNWEDSGSSDEFYDAREDINQIQNDKTSTVQSDARKKNLLKNRASVAPNNDDLPANDLSLVAHSKFNSVKESETVVENLTSAKIPDEAKSVWECVHCTFHNTSTNNVCEICMKTTPNSCFIKPSKPPASPTKHQPKPPLHRQIPGLKEQGEIVNPALQTPFNAGKLKKNEKRRQEEELHRQGMQLVQCLRNFEVNTNLTISEFETLLACTKNDLSLYDSLREEVWNQLLEHQMCIVNSVNHHVGKFTRDEVKDSLVKMKNSDEAVQLCLEQRGILIKSMKGLFNHVAEEKIIEAIEESCGNEDLLLQTLSRQCLQPLDTYIWGDDEPDNDVPIIEQAQFIEFIYDTQQQAERRTRAILIESSLKSWGRADLVIKIIDDYAAKLNDSVELSDVIEAVRNCRDVKSSLEFLNQECVTCFDSCPMSKIQSLSCCDCKICVHCFKEYFELKIKEANIQVYKLMCPVCEKPGMNDISTLETYFMMLDICLQNLLPAELHRKFQDRLTEWNLMNDPNFRWCSHCETGFLVQQEQLKMTCPECRKHTCFKCKKPWENAHDGISCEAFSEWKLLNDPATQGIGLAKYLAENGIDCPNCKYHYVLAKGGCMHFICQNPSKSCGFEFCCGCKKSFARSEACTFGRERCKSLGIHCHHPRDCLFYLRDIEIERLQDLLGSNDVEFKHDEDEASVNKCPVMEQHEYNNEGTMQLKDEPCGKEIEDAGLCRVHYIEYLVSLINKKNLDPIDVMTAEEMSVVVKRQHKQELLILEGETNEEFLNRLTQYIKTEIPLENH